jgi:hypothetical protein
MAFTAGMDTSLSGDSYDFSFSLKHVEATNEEAKEVFRFLMTGASLQELIDSFHPTIDRETLEALYLYYDNNSPLVALQQGRCYVCEYNALRIPELPSASVSMTSGSTSGSSSSQGSSALGLGVGGSHAACAGGSYPDHWDCMAVTHPRHTYVRGACQLAPPPPSSILLGLQKELGEDVNIADD